MTISPGVTTGELMAFFLKYNVCFESDVLLPTVTYGGVLTGGCHVRIMFSFILLLLCFHTLPSSILEKNKTYVSLRVKKCSTQACHVVLQLQLAIRIRMLTYVGCSRAFMGRMCNCI